MKKMLRSLKKAKARLVERIGVENILTILKAVVLYVFFYNLTGDEIGGAFIPLFLFMLKKALDYIVLEDVDFSDVGAVAAGILIAYLIMLI